MSVRTYLQIFCAVLLVQAAEAQRIERETPHQYQARIQPGAKDEYRLPVVPEQSFPHRKAANRTLAKTVMGYHPYWRNDETITRYRFDLLSHVVYFSMGIDVNTGEVTTLRDWMNTPLVDSAHAHGCKVHLCITNFGYGNNLRLLQNVTARDTLIAQLIRYARMRNADGINLDFESVPEEARDSLVVFCRDLKMRMNTAMPGSELSSAMPAVDWNDSWDVAALSQYIDIFFVMCYDYHWSGSSTAGPVAPVKGGSYNVTKTIDWYLNNGVPKAQLVMGVPYYGYDWAVTSDAMNASTTATGKALIYRSTMNGVALNGRLWSDTWANPWYKYQSTTTWHQVWFDDSVSLGAKYDLALDRDIAGVGMWALSYDDGRNELWDLLEEKFTVPVGVTPVASPAACTLGNPYPNPVQNGGVVSVPYTQIAQEGEYCVYDALGRELVRQRITGTSGVISVQVAAYPAGTYYLRLVSGMDVRNAMLHIVR